MFSNQTSQHSQQVSVMDRRKKRQNSQLLCASHLQCISFLYKKLHCWQTRIYFQKVKLLPSSKVLLRSNADQLPVCTGLTTFISSAIWFSDKLPPVCEVSQKGKPCRHTNTHHQHHSSLTHQQPGSCSTSPSCSEPLHHFKTHQKGVSYRKRILLKEFFLRLLPVFVFWILNSKRMACASIKTFSIIGPGHNHEEQRGWSFEPVLFGMKFFYSMAGKAGKRRWWNRLL